MKLSPKSQIVLWMTVAGGICAILGVVGLLLPKHDIEPLKQTIKDGIGSNIGSVSGGNVNVKVNRE